MSSRIASMVRRVRARWRRLWTQPLPEPPWFSAPRQTGNDPFAKLFEHMADDAKLRDVMRALRQQQRESDAAIARIDATMSRLRRLARARR